MSPALRSQVVQFLLEFKRAAIAQQDGIKFGVWSRDKNWSALPELGLTERQRDECLLQLQPEDYCKGPVPDENQSRGGEVWVFGKDVHGQMAYIKLKLVPDEPYPRAECLSFHKAELPLSFPLGM